MTLHSSKMWKLLALNTNQIQTFELEAKEICPHPTCLLPPPTVSKNFCPPWQFCPIWQFSTLAEPSVRLVWMYIISDKAHRRFRSFATCMNYGSHFAGQKWNRVIDFFGDVLTLILTYSNPDCTYLETITHKNLKRP